MNIFKLVILGALILLGSCANAQNTKGSVIGEYEVGIVPVNQDSLDSIRNRFPIRGIQPIIFAEFSSLHTLKLKWNRRFTITDSRGITDIGLNTDNPKVHGKYRIKNDTLILKYRYCIQHFYRSAPKRRVKTKFESKDRAAPMKRFARTEKNIFIINQRYYWKRKGA